MPEPARRASSLVGAAVVVGAALVVLVGLLARGAPLDAPTTGLAAAAGALVYALLRMFALVRALARPDAVAQVGRGVGSFTQAELRDEKRRLLRAIKELEFDHGMGKLSQQDFDAVIGTYRVRAIEVMRALEGGAAVHPELQRLLTARAEPRVAAAAEAPAAARSAPEGRAFMDTTSRICAKCSGNNENDARFCKHCGAELMREAEPAFPTPPPVTMISGELDAPAQEAGT